MSGARTPVGENYFVHTRSDRPRSQSILVYNGDRGGFPGGWGGTSQSVVLTTLPHLEPRFKMDRAITLPSLCASIGMLRGNLYLYLTHQTYNIRNNPSKCEVYCTFDTKLLTAFLITGYTVKFSH